MKQHFAKVTTSFSFRLLIFIGVLLYSNSVNSQTIESVKYTADSMMQTMLGPEYFSKTKLMCLKVLEDHHFSFCDSDSVLPNELINSLASKYDLASDRKYNLLYDIELEGKYSYPVVLTFNSLGECHETIWDIPACRESSYCRIEIDSIAAKKIAEANDFPKGVAEWEVSLIHDNTYGYLCWYIKSVTKIIENGSSRRRIGTACRVRTFDGKFSDGGSWETYQYGKG